MSLFGNGLGVALATPFTPDHGIDTGAFVRLVHHVTQGGTDFVVALGSTGEAAMLDDAERDHIITTALEHAGEARVFVGTGAQSTAQTVRWTRAARELGAHGALVVVPPYTRPTQAGLLAHYEAVVAAVEDLPIIVYNVPGRTATNLQAATMRALWSLPSIVAVKESSGDLQQIARIASETPDDRTLLAGDDALLLPTIAVGGRGVVSVAGNVVPKQMHELLHAARRGDLARARDLHAALLPLFDALSAEPNPIPVKTALALLGIADAAMRLPLLPAGETTRDRLRKALHAVTEQVSHA
ncbi:MAG TPA: 4-hydroxy-tetrahydrodipicolinate synthase [Planctomycetota bacterium]|nr:4-hydroxy-tetrahydrodipicolinate synthase [Planctomycetota bacterium]